MSISTIGLAVYVLSVLIGAGLLLFDLGLDVRHEQTITAWATSQPIRGWLLFVLVLAGPLGLLLHFITFRR